MSRGMNWRITYDATIGATLWVCLAVALVVAFGSELNVALEQVSAAAMLEAVSAVSWGAVSWALAGAMRGACS